MKKIFVLFVLILAGATAWTEAKPKPFNLPVAPPEDFEFFSYKVSLEETELLPLEPASLHFKIESQAPEPITTRYFKSLSKSTLRITSETGLVKEFKGLTLPNVCCAHVPFILAPGSSISESATLTKNLDEMFPAPGKYELQFSIALSGGDDHLIHLKSNIVPLSIKEPTGLVSEALAFIRANQFKSNFRYYPFWSYEAENKEGERLLETFVNRYGSTPYGERAAQMLVSDYIYLDELDWAQELLEKLQTSKNPKIAADAKKRLAEVAERRARGIKTVINSKPPIDNMPPIRNFPQ